MDKKKFIEKLNDEIMAMSIFTENCYEIGKYTLLWAVGGEKRISKFRTQKTICYQCNTPNENGSYSTIEIIIERKTTKKETSFKAINAIVY